MAEIKLIYGTIPFIVAPKPQIIYGTIPFITTPFPAVAEAPPPPSDNISSINGVNYANIASFSGIAKANISFINGIST